MADELVVEPRPGVAPVTETVEETVTEAPAAATELSDDLLRIPAFQALIAGAPAAVSANLAALEKKPEAKIIAQSKDSLMGAGIGLYRSLDGANGVFFNQLFVSPDEIKAADQAGTLMELAPPFDQVNAEVAKSGGANPVLTAGERPQGFKTAPTPSPGPMAPPPVAPPSASAQKTAANQRMKNLQPGAPTSGPVPGEGRLLNTILRPVL